MFAFDFFPDTERLGQSFLLVVFLSYTIMD
jgi:hypothetical protein